MTIELLFYNPQILWSIDVIFGSIGVHSHKYFKKDIII